MAREVTRRQLLAQTGSAAAGLAGLSVFGCSSAAMVKAPTAGGTVVPDAKVVDGYRSFVTRPDLNPPVVTLARKVTGSQARHFFMNAPYTGPGRGGAIIIDGNGDLVWMGVDTGPHKIDFNLQTYQGEPHLTWWEGRETHGWGQGVSVVADTSYRRKHTIHAVGKDLMTDHHEFTVTAKNTALVTVYKTRTGVDLRPVGGPKDGVMVSGVCQEIDIATNKLLFEWDSFDHVAIEDTYQPFLYNDEKFGVANNPYDYFHINSLTYAPDGNLLIGSRNTWCLYKVSRHTGKIIWRLNGKKSDFKMGPGSHFFFQHHIRQHGNDTLTVFDNGSNPVEEAQSRGLVLNFDEAGRRVSLRHQYTHPHLKLLASAMGSCQLLPDGNVLVGWGTNSYFSEFSPDGRLLVAAAMTHGNPSYRVFGYEFTGQPVDKPDVAARHSPGGTTVYASWNGATEQASWTVLAGKTRSSLLAAGQGHRNGFETAIAVRHPGPYFAVRAHDAKGNVLATSDTVKIR